MQSVANIARVLTQLIPRFILPSAIFLLVAASSQAQPIPLADKRVHMGVATCAGSTCHGAVEPWKGSNIRQNEFVLWQRKDKHAKAYQALLSDRSKRIARNLGLKSAQTAKICLDCHADNVPLNQRHRSFQLSDGVTSLPEFLARRQERCGSVLGFSQPLDHGNITMRRDSIRN